LSEAMGAEFEPPEPDAGLPQEESRRAAGSKQESAVRTVIKLREMRLWLESFLGRRKARRKQQNIEPSQKPGVNEPNMIAPGESECIVMHVSR